MWWLIFLKIKIEKNIFKTIYGSVKETTECVIGLTLSFWGGINYEYNVHIYKNHTFDTKYTKKYFKWAINNK